MASIQMSKPTRLVGCWLDQSIGEAGTHLPLKKRFESVSNRITKWHYFSGGDDFKAFLDSNPNIRLVAIMSGAFAKQQVCPVSNRDSLHSVYVLCGNLGKYGTLLADEEKIKGIFNDENLLFERMQKDLREEL